MSSTKSLGGFPVVDDRREISYCFGTDKYVVDENPLIMPVVDDTYAKLILSQTEELVVDENPREQSVVDENPPNLVFLNLQRLYFSVRQFCLIQKTVVLERYK